MQFDIILGLLIFLFSLAPVVVLANLYYKTKVSDLLIFMWFYVVGGLVQISNIFAIKTSFLFLYKLQYLGSNLTFFLLFLYIIRIKWDFSHNLGTKSFKFIFLIGLICFLSLEISIILWFQYYEQYYGSLFAMFVSIIATYTYSSIKIKNFDLEIKKAKKIWIIGFSFLLIFTIFTLPILMISLNIARIMLIIGLIITFYIPIWMPEAMLISKTQLLRAVHLYKIAEKHKEKQYESNLKMETLYEYILLAQKKLNIFDDNAN